MSAPMSTFTVTVIGSAVSDEDTVSALEEAASVLVDTVDAAQVVVSLTQPLSFTVLSQVMPLVDMVEHNRKVVRLVGETRYEGMARSLGSENGGFGFKGEDVRDMFMRVTLRSGFEAFWPVRDLMPEVSAHTFVAYDWA